jgi:raffinose/stachyose/melibiose transport system substrate-binding protein
LTTSAEAQQLVADSLVNVPSLKSVQPRPTGLVDDAIQAASLAEVVKSVQDATEPRQIPYADLVTALGDAMSAVATGGKTPQEAAADLQKVSSSIQR